MRELYYFSNWFMIIFPFVLRIPKRQGFLFIFGQSRRQFLHIQQRQLGIVKVSMLMKDSKLAAFPSQSFHVDEGFKVRSFSMFFKDIKSQHVEHYLKGLLIKV